MHKMGRNDLCQCGRGKKYKRCCRPLASSTVRERPPVLSCLQLALEHHQAGRFTQAQALYRQILQAERNHADALHFLGVIAEQTGEPEGGTALMKRAISLNPSNPSYYSNLGHALKKQGKLDEAAGSFRKAL